MNTLKRIRVGNALLILASLILVAALIVSAYFFFARPEEFKTSIPLMIMVYSLPVPALVLIIIGMNLKKNRGTAQKSVSAGFSDLTAVMLMGLVALWFLWSPSSSNGIIWNSMNNSKLIDTTKTWPDAKVYPILLNDAASDRSVIIVYKYGPVLNLSEMNNKLPGKLRAVGSEMLRFVVIIEEVETGETLSEKWQAYYKRGFDVTNPNPVKYIHYDWDVLVVDLDTQTVLNRTLLSAEPPDDYRRPLESTVRVTPSDEQLLRWLGFQGSDITY